ncbi:hypothetical protein ElyMa_005204500 [Elysia marginata]|uniref:PH domain-containing protein n=1 Tax=Elysia marginata TaxID=1093978 RepID=A0AAV4JZZ5_9GAST|nr:hypothetical protein ElyMa_005204500 [Elysia marginata]
MVINSGKRKQRGFRDNKSPMVSKKKGIYISPHCTGRGIDFNFEGETAVETRKWIEGIADELPHKIRMERSKNAGILALSTIIFWKLFKNSKGKGLSGVAKSEAEKLMTITNKYKDREYNFENFNIGGGLDEFKFASRRHEDAKHDKGKETFGKVVQMFKSATGEDTDFIKKVIKYNVPAMEWHHAGRLPQSYGGGMKKTYYLNAEQIAEISSNWEGSKKKYLDSMEKDENENDKRAALKKRIDKLQRSYGKKRGVYMTRIPKEEKPKYFATEKEEMEGKYGWFEAKYTYNLPVYISGWAFKTKKALLKFTDIETDLKDEFYRSLD